MEYSLVAGSCAMRLGDGYGWNVVKLHTGTNDYALRRQDTVAPSGNGTAA